MILIYYAVISFPQETLERDKLTVCIIGLEAIMADASLVWKKIRDV